MRWVIGRSIQTVRDVYDREVRSTATHEGWLVVIDATSGDLIPMVSMRQVTGQLVVAEDSNELGPAAPEVSAGDPAATGSLDCRHRRCALRLGTLVGRGICCTPDP
jgi:hypothetical protein